MSTIRHFQASNGYLKIITPEGVPIVFAGGFYSTGVKSQIDYILQFAEDLPGSIVELTEAPSEKIVASDDALSALKAQMRKEVMREMGLSDSESEHKPVLGNITSSADLAAMADTGGGTEVTATATARLASAAKK